MKARLIGYARVSTEDQAMNGVGLDVQVEKIKAYCAIDDDVELVGIIHDDGISAKNIVGRPGFQEALATVLSGKADGLVVYKLDRAFRSTTDALTVAEKLNKKGKSLHSITEKLDTTTAIGEFFFTLMASLAQMERRLIGERTRAAMSLKRDRGERISRFAPYGYTFDGGSVVLVETEQDVIVLVKRLRREGRAIQAIVDTLEQMGIHSRTGKPMSTALIHKILKSEPNVNGEVVSPSPALPVIVDEATWSSVEPTDVAGPTDPEPIEDAPLDPEQADPEDDEHDPDAPDPLAPW